MVEELQQKSTVPPHVDNLNLNEFVLSGLEKQQLLESYKVLLGRLMIKNMPAFKWMESVIPKHIPHEYSHISAKKSTVLPLKMVLKNEAKYEDCVQILEESQKQMKAHYGAAFGQFKNTKKHGVYLHVNCMNSS